VLDKLSPRVRSDVLADGTLSSTCRVPVQHPVELGPDHTVSCDSLFAAFRAAADGCQPLPLKDLKGKKLKAKVAVGPDGWGTVEIPGRRIRFESAGLLTGKPAQRLELVANFLKTRSLARAHEEELVRLAGKSDFTPEDFFACGQLLNAAPEAFAATFEAQLAAGRIGTRELIPDDLRYWDNLTACHKGATTLAAFIAGELAAERERRLLSDPSRALRIMTLTFPAPALVPITRLREWDTDAFATIIAGAVDVDDHFALVGLFELCADRIASAPEFVPLGERLLKQLLEKPDRLRIACTMFGAAFIIATAHLAIHEILGRRPVFWRRLAAAAHASLVVRVCGVTDIKPDELLNWAFAMVGEDYFASTFNDMAVEPQWRPDWIAPRFLHADAIGRLAGAVHHLAPEHRPAAWTALIEPVWKQLETEHKLFLTTYPAVLEGERRPPPSLATLGDLAKPVREFMNEPDIDTLLMIGPIIQSHGFPEEAADAVLKVVDSIRRNPVGLDDGATQAALSVAAHVAVKSCNVALTDAVARVCLDKLRDVKSRNPLLDGTFRLIECAGAYPDREAGQVTLSRWMQELAHNLTIELTPDLDSLLDAITRANPGLAPKLGRPRAVVRLGFPRGRAA
jgi:hypothetical protein